MGLNVILIGAPGAGKGTQAGRFARENRIPKISTGDILREAMRTPGAMAPEARARMDRGELVDDQTMIAIVRDRLWRADAREGFVLDGFPRTVSQAQALDVLVQERGNGPLIVVDIEVADHELVRRLAGRRVCATCGTNAGPSAPLATRCEACGGLFVQRVDDNQQVVLDRLKVYAQTTRPVLEYYRERLTFRVVDGAQAPEFVARELDAMVADAAVAGAAAQR